LERQAEAQVPINNTRNRVDTVGANTLNNKLMEDILSRATNKVTHPKEDTSKVTHLNSSMEATAVAMGAVINSSKSLRSPVV
jgi:hypothetical protein